MKDLEDFTVLHNMGVMVVSLDLTLIVKILADHSKSKHRKSSPQLKWGIATCKMIRVYFFLAFLCETVNWVLVKDSVYYWMEYNTTIQHLEN